MSRLAPELSTRNETPHERADRHLAELLQEVRVAQTGVQVLFGFLLTVPFTARFEDLTAAERHLYLATLCVAGAAAMLLIAPSAQHRVLWRCNDKENNAVAGVIAAIAAAGALWSWYVQPLLRRRHLYRNALPAVRPLNRQPPRKVPSSAR